MSYEILPPYQLGDLVMYQPDHKLGTAEGTVTKLFYRRLTYEIDDKYIVNTTAILCISKTEKRKLNLNIKS